MVGLTSPVILGGGQPVVRDTTERSLDDLARGLATGTLSRGKAIRWMGGALLGAALASVPGVAWADSCSRLGRECRRDSQCCSRNCVRRGDDKVCGCPEGRTRCNDRCVNLETNENHCGSCSNRCAEGEECVDGECCGGCVSNGGSCAADSECCSSICDSGTCAECRSGGGPCPDCCSFVCTRNGICVPPGGPNYVACACVDGSGEIRCSSAACGSSELDRFCAAVCATSGGVANLTCDACSTNCGPTC
jgi:hypothetical protein